VSEDSNLKNRVEHAIGQMTASHERRRHSNQSLSDVLAQLEQKYNGRSNELSQCRDRIAELTAANEELSALLDRIVPVTETHSHDDGDETIRRAADMARDIVRSWGGDPSADVTPAPVKALAAAPAMRFEDVSAEELAAELVAEQAAEPVGGVEASEPILAAESPVEIVEELTAEPADVPGLAEAPAMVEAAVEQADDVIEVAELEEVSDAEILAEAAESAVPAFDEVEIVEDEATGEIEFETAAEASDEGEAVEIDIPEPASAAKAAPARPAAKGAHETTREDIRAMLDRLERAAARAQAFADEQAKSKAATPAPRARERSG
jgi:hypothetical protein